MRYKKTVPAREVVVDGKATCDLCNRVIEERRGWDCTEVTLEAQIGDIFQETDWRTIYEADTCGDCFLNKVRPALEAIGLRFRERRAEEDGRVWEVPPTGASE